MVSFRTNITATDQKVTLSRVVWRTFPSTISITDIEAKISIQSTCTHRLCCSSDCSDRLFLERKLEGGHKRCVVRKKHEKRAKRIRKSLKHTKKNDFFCRLVGTQRLLYGRSLCRMRNRWSKELAWIYNAHLSNVNKTISTMFLNFDGTHRTIIEKNVQTNSVFFSLEFQSHIVHAPHYTYTYHVDVTPASS